MNIYIYIYIYINDHLAVCITVIMEVVKTRRNKSEKQPCFGN